MQGTGRMGKLTLQTPAMIHFGAGDRGRGLHHARSRDGRRRDREHRQRAAGRPALLRPRHVHQGAQRRRLQEVDGLQPSRDGFSRPAQRASSDRPRNAVDLAHSRKDACDDVRTSTTFPSCTTRPGPAWSARATGAEPPIDLDTMLDLTAAAEVDGVKFDGFDLFLFAPHINIDASDDELQELADKAQSRGLDDRHGRRARSGRRPAAARPWATTAERKKFLDAGPQGLPHRPAAARAGRPAPRRRADRLGLRRRPPGRPIPEGNTEADRRDVPQGLRHRRGPRRAAGRRRRDLLGRHAQLAADGPAAGDGRPPADARLPGRHGPHAAVPAGLQRPGRRASCRQDFDWQRRGSVRRGLQDS